ncbi:molybdate metabolism regulator [Bremerella cremea]|uniref:molybdate metabolism regulator n=1 Tax=Bremerella cremea TaxID=1031537 RepID=UPI0031E64F4F
MSDHDPFNEPETAHVRARKLMTEEFFWDCVDEQAPFGSDEGSDAYYEWRDWREENPDQPLMVCLDWILDGQSEQYNASLYTDERIAQDLADPSSAFLADHWDIDTLDITILATALGQLLDEGTIDADAKPLAIVAIERQLRRSSDPRRQQILNAARRVVDNA